MPSDRHLMRLHVEALFEHDAAGRLVRVNEPGGAPAPRLFLGRTADGVVRRYRHDVPDAVRRALEAAAGDDGPGPARIDAPDDPGRYVEILARCDPVRRTWAGPAFRFPPALPSTAGAVVVGESDIALLHPHLPGWAPDVRRCDPFVALVVDGRAVAVCCSVRKTPRAHEAGVETAPGHRGRGHAAAAVAGWARAVRAIGVEPLYSTSWENAASRAVARRLGLVPFGSDLHLT